MFLILGIKYFFVLASILFIQADFMHFCRLPPPSTLEMLVPANAVGKVMGKGGANIANIRKVCSCLFSLAMHTHKSSRDFRKDSMHFDC